LSADDIAALRLAADVVMRRGGAGGQAAERALARLSHRPAASAPPVTEALSRWATSEASTDAGHVRPLFRAITDRRRVSFRYRTGETPADQSRRLEPWGVGYRNGAWYLAGHDLDRRDARVLRVGRIAGAVKLGRRENSFTVPPDADLSTLLQASSFGFGPMRGPAAEARLVLDEETATQVTPMLPEWVPVRALADGRTAVRLFVHDAGSFFDW